MKSIFSLFVILLYAFAFIVLTDDYGSIPYFEGGVGYSQ